VVELNSDKKHEAWLKFASDVLNVPVGRSKQDLENFVDVAMRDQPSLVPIIEEYLNLARKSDTAVQLRKINGSSPLRGKPKQMHLFDLLREKTFFPQNLDLSSFASRVLPRMRSYRFDKMSRSDIAARIIEYIEGTDPKTRQALEVSMREALSAMSGRPTKEIERQSFLSKWERIIKGVE
jgi:hypothetical protein